MKIQFMKKTRPWKITISGMKKSGIQGVSLGLEDET